MQSIQVLTDTNGLQYSEIKIQNSEPLLDSVPFTYITIEGFMSGSDTIFPSNPYSLYSHFIHNTKDTTVSYRIDTTLSSSSITGILIRRGVQSCGMLLLDNIVVTNICESNLSLSTTDLEKKKINIFPNPSKGQLFMQGNFDPNTVVSITTSDGKLVRSICIDQNSPLDISFLPNGIYYLHVNGYQDQKIVIEK